MIRGNAKYFFEQPHLYLDNNPGILVREQIVRKMLGAVSSCRILDVGCGDGSVSLPFLYNNNRVTLIDMSYQMLCRARENIPHGFEHLVQLMECDILSYYPQCKFDIILCLGVLAHVNCVDDVIGKMASILTSNGLCIIQITDHDKLLARVINRVMTIRNRIIYEYTTNRTTYRDILLAASKHGLKLNDIIRCWPIFPGMSKLISYRIRCRYQLFSMNNRYMSKLGSNVYLLFSLQ